MESIKLGRSGVGLRGSLTATPHTGKRKIISCTHLLSGLINTLIGGTANPPLLPTLGSLAVAVELFYQGWVFKGYFTNFRVEESVSLGPGIFSYTLEFTVLDRRGIRNNFTASSRSAGIFDNNGKPISYYKANADGVPLSFRGEK